MCFGGPGFTTKLEHEEVTLQSFSMLFALLFKMISFVKECEKIICLLREINKQTEQESTHLNILTPQCEEAMEVINSPEGRKLARTCDASVCQEPCGLSFSLQGSSALFI